MKNLLFRPLGYLALSLALVGGLAFWLLRHPPGQPARTPLVLYCAAGLKEPIERSVQAYGQLTGVPVQVQYGGSQTLLAGIEISRRGDLYLPADESYLLLAREKKLIAESIPLGRMRLAVGVKKGNPKQIRQLADLQRPDVRLAQGDPDATAVGQKTREVLEPSGSWEPLRRQTAVFKMTVNDVANDLKLGAVDAGFIWDAVLTQYPELDVVHLPEFTNAYANIAVSVLSGCRQPAAALRLMRFLGAPEHGLEQFARAGYEVLPGDTWAETPELVLYSGALNRVAVEQSIEQFEQREGVRVSRIYNGCGILVAQMKAGGRPDAYLTCDASFVPPVAELFQGTPLAVSRTDIVILTGKGNPRGVYKLSDLATAGLRVGVANPEQSTLGALTRRLLQQAGCYAGVMSNVVTQTPTADLLVNQIRTGALDAVVVYTANTLKVKELFEVVPLALPGATATQTFSVGAASKHKQLAGRLHHALRSSESQARYQSAGFEWVKEATDPAQ